MRVTEAKAREANAPGEIRASRRKGGVHPDQARGRDEIGEALGRALGAEVRVRPTRDGGYRAELTFDDAEEAHELAARLAARPADPGLALAITPRRAPGD